MLYSMYISDAALTNYAANKRNETNRVKSKCGQKANAMEKYAIVMGCLVHVIPCNLAA